MYRFIVFKSLERKTEAGHPPMQFFGIHPTAWGKVHTRSYHRLEIPYTYEHTPTTATEFQEMQNGRGFSSWTYSGESSGLGMVLTFVNTLQRRLSANQYNWYRLMIENNNNDGWPPRRRVDVVLTPTANIFHVCDLADLSMVFGQCSNNRSFNCMNCKPLMDKGYDGIEFHIGANDVGSGCHMYNWMNWIGIDFPMLIIWRWCM